MDPEDNANALMMHDDLSSSGVCARLGVRLCVCVRVRVCARVFERRERVQGM